MNFNNGHYSCITQDKMIINRIMQRFRPIAPKPVTERSDVPSVAELVSSRRKKRKFVRVNKNNKPNCSVAEAYKGDRTFDGGVDAFLSPLGLNGSEDKGSFTVWSFTPELLRPTYTYPNKSVDGDIMTFSVRNVSDLGDGTPSRKVVESWLVVDDGLTETCHYVSEIGNTDTEKMRNLEMDTCPGLISNGNHKVLWINHAYQKMVDIDEKEEVAMINMVVRQKIPETCQVFTCSVRVMYKKKYTQTMPCDVWRMDYGGGFAWRLDATAALKLGR